MRNQSGDILRDVRIGADEIVTYDDELAGRATAVGVHVLSPGTSS